MSEFNWVPLVNAKAQYQPKTNEAPFGDGYSQRSAKGINNNPGQWPGLQFAFKDETEADKVEAFLASRQGAKSFTWTPPRKSEIKVVCKQWARDYAEENRTKITVTFEQVFE